MSQDLTAARGVVLFFAGFLVAKFEIISLVLTMTTVIIAVFVALSVGTVLLAVFAVSPESRTKILPARLRKARKPARTMKTIRTTKL